MASPLAYQVLAGASRTGQAQGGLDILQPLSLALNETGSSKGLAATSAVQQALHAGGLLHSSDPNPVRIDALAGDITGIKLFSPKETHITAGEDISDVALYLQNDAVTDISVVSAGGDVITFNENAAVRTVATDFASGNVIGDAKRSTASGDSTTDWAGDITINGPRVLEVFDGGHHGIGTGRN